MKNPEYKTKLEILRRRFPIGLLYGIRLLDKTNGDLEKAEQCFQEEMIALVVDKTGVKEDVARKHLLMNDFDIESVLRTIDQERYTLTERILNNYGSNREEALNTVFSALIEYYSITREFWLNIDDLKELPREVTCVLTCVEWLNYESWESFESALSFHLSFVTNYLEHDLNLADLANLLKKALIIRENHLIDRDAGSEYCFYACRTLQDNNEFGAFLQDFRILRPVMIDRLYDYVKKHSDKFP